MPWKRKTVDDQKRKFVARATQGEKSLGAHCAENTGAAGRPDTSCWNGTGTGRACRTDHTRRFAGRSGPPGRRSCGSWMYGMRIQPGVPGRFSDIYWTRVRTAFRRPVRSATFSSGTAASARLRLSSGSRCHGLTILDDHSRFSLCLDAKENERWEPTKASLIRVFEKFGLPDAILCDNGAPWSDNHRTPAR